MPGTADTTSYLSVVAGAGVLEDEVAPGVPMSSVLAEAVLEQQRHDAHEAAFDSFERDVFGVDR